MRANLEKATSWDNSHSRRTQPFRLRFTPTLETLEDRVVPSGTPPVITTSLPDLILAPNQQRDIEINVTDDDPPSSLRWEAEFGTEAYLIDHQFQLVNATNLHFNWSGFRMEKWVQDVHGAWYFILPNGEFRAWDGNPLDATGTLIAVLDPIYHFAPNLLTDAANPASLGIYQQALDMAYVLDTHLNFQDPNAPGVGGLWENWGGRNERWILGTNFQGAAQWFFILPNGELYWWDNQSGANGWLTARLDPMYYQVDMLRELTESGGLIAPNPPAVTVNFASPSSNDFNNTLIISPNNQRGTIWVQAQVSDDTSTGFSRIFEVTFRNTAPILNNPGTVNVPANATTQFNLSGQDPNPGDTLTWDIGFAQNVLGIPFLQLQTGTQLPPLTYSPLSDNWGGPNTRWFQAPNGQWYFLNQTRDLFRWDGQSIASGTFLGTLPLEYLNNPILLEQDTHAAPPSGANISVDGTGQVTVTMPAGLGGQSFAVIAMLSDGMTTTARRFVIAVN